MEWNKLVFNSMKEVKNKLSFLVIIIFIAGGIPAIIKASISLILYFKNSYEISGGNFTSIPFYIIMLISFIGFWFILGALVYSMQERGFLKSLNKSFKKLHKIILIAILFSVLSMVFSQNIIGATHSIMKQDMVDYAKNPQQYLVNKELPIFESSDNNISSIILNILSIFLFFLVFTIPELMINNSGIIKSIKNSFNIFRKNPKEVLILYLITVLIPLILGTIPLAFAYVSSSLALIFYLFVYAIATIINWILITRFYVSIREFVSDDLSPV